jgi:hypothetical protein
MRLIFLVPVAAASLGLVACSSGAASDITAVPGGDGAAMVVTAYAKALAHGDGARACSLASPEMQRDLLAQTRSGNCLESVKSIATSLVAGQGAEVLRDIEVVDARLAEDGRVATIQVDAGSSAHLGGAYVTLLWEEQHWQIDDVR